MFCLVACWIWYLYGCFVWRVELSDVWWWFDWFYACVIQVFCLFECDKTTFIPNYIKYIVNMYVGMLFICYRFARHAFTVISPCKLNINCPSKTNLLRVKQMHMTCIFSCRFITYLLDPRSCCIHVPLFKVTKRHRRNLTITVHSVCLWRLYHNFECQYHMFFVVFT